MQDAVKTISKEVTKIKNKLEKLQLQLKTIQDNCPHTNVEYKYGGNTGNYDPTADVYWVDHKCNDCDKYWRVYK